MPIPAGSDQSLLSAACSVPHPFFERAVALYFNVCGLLGSLVIELTYLVRVSAATFQHPDCEIAHYLKHAWGVHTSFL